MNSLDELLNATASEVLGIQIDYRPIFAEEMRAIVHYVFNGQGIADDEAANLTRCEIAPLLEAARQHFPLHNIPKLQEALTEFRRGLSAIISERQGEKRKASSFKHQIERCIARDEFRPFAYGRAETLALETLCRDGDEIISVDFDQIVIERDGAQRVITRHDLIEATRPSTSSHESWRKAGGFVSDSKVKERRESLEKAEYNAAHPDSGRSITKPDGSVVRA